MELLCKVTLKYPGKLTDLHFVHNMSYEYSITMAIESVYKTTEAELQDDGYESLAFEIHWWNPVSF